MVSYAYGPNFAKPLPEHMHETPDLVAARAMHADFKARRQRLDRLSSSLVTEHGNPRPYAGDPVTDNARKLHTLALERMSDARLVIRDDACFVSGIDRERKVGFVAKWRDRSAVGGLWYARFRYEFEEDNRPFGVSQRDLVTLAGKRHPRGASSVRLRLRDSPYGMPCNVTEITRRVESLT